MKAELGRISTTFIGLVTLAGAASAATEIEFGSNRTVDEDDGVVWIELRRSGDLGEASVVSWHEDWSRNGTTAEKDDLLYNPAAAPSNVFFYSNSTRYGTVVFYAGDSRVRIPYRITNDQREEVDERLYFSLKSPSSGTRLGDDSLYVKIRDDDEPAPTPILDVFSDDVDEGGTARVRIRTTPAVDYSISFDVYTVGGSARNNEDYNGFTAKSVTIRANDDDEYVSVSTNPNNDPNDREKETLRLCIEPDSVPNGVLVGQQCGDIVITDVPLPPEVTPILDVFSDDVEEGGTARVRIRTTPTVDYSISFDVYTVGGSAHNNEDYNGFTAKSVTIRANDDDEYVSVSTNPNNDPNDREKETLRLCIEPDSVPNGVLVGQQCGDIVITDVPTPTPPANAPTLSIYEGGIANEGGVSGTYAALDSPTNQDVTFLVSTYYGTYQQANYPIQDDYEGLADRSFTISAGSTQVAIPIVVHQNNDPEDGQYESTQVCIEPNSVLGARLGTACTPLVIMDVPASTTPPATAASPIVFDEGCGDGWCEVGGQDRHVNTASRHGYESSIGIWFQTTAPGGSLQLRTSNGCSFDSTGYTTLSFAYNLGEYENELPYVGLLDEHGDVLQYVVLNATPEFTWNPVSVNLAELGVFDQVICGVEFLTANTGTIEIDAIRFGNDASPPSVPPEAGDIAEEDLTDLSEFMADLETEFGTTTAAEIVGESDKLAEVAKTIDYWDFLSRRLREALTLFPLYANAEEIESIDDLPSVTEIEAEVRRTLVLKMRQGYLLAPNRFGVTAQTSLSWSAAEALAEQDRQADAVTNNGDDLEQILLLHAGDYVDGRLVIHQPWVAFDSKGEYLRSRSVQGRYTSDDPSMFSHHDRNKNLKLSLSFDWSPVGSVMYAIAPIDATVIFVNTSYDVGEGVFGIHGMGNVVTLRLDANDSYFTFGHLQPDSRYLLKAGDKIKAGQVIGVIGNTGGYYRQGNWQQSDEHLHITSGHSLRNNGTVADGSHKETPPIYMLGFHSGNVASPEELGIATVNFVTDYGFPQGDSKYIDSNGNGTLDRRVESRVAWGILPTIPKPQVSFLRLRDTNPNGVEQATGLDYVPGTSGDDHYQGTSGKDIFVTSDGDDVIDCGNGFDQINAEGKDSRITDNRFISDFTGNIIMQRNDGTARKVLMNCEGIWFGGEERWHEFGDVITDDQYYTGLPYFGTNHSEERNYFGTNGSDVFLPGNGPNYFNASAGGDVYYGAPAYDQISLPGHSWSYTFTNLNDGGTKVTGPGINVDIHYHIEGYWFSGDSAWRSATDLY